MVNETFRAAPPCPGAGGEPTAVGKGHGSPSWLRHTALWVCFPTGKMKPVTTVVAISTFKGCGEDQMKLE